MSPNQTLPRHASPANPSRSEIHIRAFVPDDADAFRMLNESWITALFGLEDEDRRVLNDPVGQVLSRGGHIYIAERNAQPIGCCALILLRPDVFELGKMAVAEELRGHGVGRLLLEHVIADARRLGVRELELGSSTRLPNAVHLYESLGFRHIPPERRTPSPFARADVFMELHL